MEDVKLRDSVLVVSGRPLTAKELADLSDEWLNPTVDTDTYYQTVVCAWEVTKEIFHQWKDAGGLCQQYPIAGYENCKPQTQYFIA